MMRTFHLLSVQLIQAPTSNLISSASLNYFMFPVFPEHVSYYYLRLSETQTLLKRNLYYFPSELLLYSLTACFQIYLTRYRILVIPVPTRYLKSMVLISPKIYFDFRFKTQEEQSPMYL